jgi:drug/metabolite transporter (DMT)-like permease
MSEEHTDRQNDLSPFAERWGAALGLFATAVIWATMVPFIAALLPYFDPFLLSVLRYFLALPVLVALVFLTEGQNPFDRQLNWRQMFILGAAMTGFSTFYTLGILYSDPLTAAVVLGLSPVMAAVLSWLMHRTPLSPTVYIAITLSVVGAMLVVQGAPASSLSDSGTRGGEVLLVMATTCWSWYSFKVQAWFSTMSNLRVTTLTSATAIIWLVAIYGLFVSTGLARLPMEIPGPGPVSMLLWVSWGAAGLAIVLWHHGTSRLGVPVATLYINLIPVFAFILSSFMFSIVPNAFQIFGGLVVLAGVGLVQMNRLRNLP